MNLHEWITARVEATEAGIRAELDGLRVAFKPQNGGPAIAGTVTGFTQDSDGIHLAIAQYGVLPKSMNPPVDVQFFIAALRRCEADRRILARHKLPESPIASYDAIACAGCGVEGDCDYPVTDNINDCPELLDLAHAHGITEAELAGLDRPECELRSHAKVAHDPAWAQRIADAATQPATTDQIPEPLRGPRWGNHH